MAGNVRIKWDRSALEQVRRWPETEAELKRRADAIAAACGGEAVGFVAVTGKGRTRSRAAVIAATQRARRRNAAENTILRNLDAGRK